MGQPGHLYSRLEFICDGIFCEDLRMLKVARITKAKNFNGYRVIIVMTKFCKNCSIAKLFPSRFPGISTNIFQHKIIPVYSLHWQYTASVQLKAAHYCWLKIEEFSVSHRRTFHQMIQGDVMQFTHW